MKQNDFPSIVKEFSYDRLDWKLLKDLRQDLKESFYAWITSMTPETDNEQGTGPGGFDEWLQYHEQISTDVTYVFFDRESGAMIGTASLVKQDREREAALGGFVIAGVNVIGGLRNQGIGTAIMQFIDIQLQNRADVEQRSVPVKLFASYAPAIKIYLRLDFAKVAPNNNEYTKNYKPTKKINQP